MSGVRLCALDDLTTDSARRFDVDGEGVAVVRIGDQVFAIGDRCSHANFSLSEGEVDAASCTLECWKHGATFSLRTGVPLTLPATRAVPVYVVEIRDGDVHVTLEKAGGTPAGSEVLR